MSFHLKCNSDFSLGVSSDSVYWPLFVLIFYAISPIPHFIAQRVTYDTDATSSSCRELAYFFTTGIVVSAFGFPVILARVTVVSFLFSCFVQLWLGFFQRLVSGTSIFFCCFECFRVFISRPNAFLTCFFFI